jgi:hypothetical protein
MIALMAPVAIAASPGEIAQEAVRNHLKDPDSARFRNVTIIRVEPDGAVVCGEVNAKNSYGGYVGFRRFVVTGDHVMMDDTTSFAALAHVLCTPGR